MARTQQLREGGRFATESYRLLDYDWLSNKFSTDECYVVYADKDQPSHCVLLIKHSEKDEG